MRLAIVGNVVIVSSVQYNISADIVDLSRYPTKYESHDFVRIATQFYCKETGVMYSMMAYVTTDC
jgi:hypothetical protein